MRSVFSKHSKPDPELLHLKAELLAAQGELAQAYRRFDQAVDPELVEACIFESNAVTARCNYLLRSIKEYRPRAAQADAPARRGGTGLSRRTQRAAADGKGDVVWT